MGWLLLGCWVTDAEVAGWKGEGRVADNAVDSSTGGATHPPIDTATALHAPGEWRMTRNVGTMRWIPAGVFAMGSDEGEPGHQSDEIQHSVRLTHGYWMMVHEVKQAEWKVVTARHGYSTAIQELAYNDSCGGSCPVEDVSWCDAVVFANLVSYDEGLDPVYLLPSESALGSSDCDSMSSQVTVDSTANGYRLPTEAEWERAARGGADFKYAGSDVVDDVAWFLGNSSATSHAVCAKNLNGYQLCDMSGNVSEWVWDWYDDEYPNPAVPDSMGPENGVGRVSRGGSWSQYASWTRVASRDYWNPAYRTNIIGFRLVRLDP